MRRSSDCTCAPADSVAAAAPIGRLKTLADAYARAASPLDALFQELPGIQPAEREALAAIKERTPDPKVIEDEFVLHVLTKHGLVDREMIDHIKRDFHDLERFVLLLYNV